MRNCCKALNTALLSLALACAVAGCSSSTAPPPDQVAHPLEQNAINALTIGATDEIGPALAAALARYRLVDNLAGQWRVHLLRVNHFLSLNDLEQAQVEAQELGRVAKHLADTAGIAYQTALVNGRVSQQPGAFREAFRLAATPLERAVALTYLGDVAEAVAALDADGTDHPADRAFVLYQYAQSSDQPADYERALHYYRLAQNSRGVADTLVALARHAARAGKTDEARSYAVRAVHSLTAAGDRARAQVIRDWLTSL